MVATFVVPVDVGFHSKKIYYISERGRSPLEETLDVEIQACDVAQINHYRFPNHSLIFKVEALFYHFMSDIDSILYIYHIYTID